VSTKPKPRRILYNNQCSSTNITFIRLLKRFFFHLIEYIVLTTNIYISVIFAEIYVYFVEFSAK